MTTGHENKRVLFLTFLSVIPAVGGNKYLVFYSPITDHLKCWPVFYAMIRKRSGEYRCTSRHDKSQPTADNFRSDNLKSLGAIFSVVSGKCS